MYFSETYLLITRGTSKNKGILSQTPTRYAIQIIRSKTNKDETKAPGPLQALYPKHLQQHASTGTIHPTSL
jgi:hypothetical protein